LKFKRLYFFLILIVIGFLLNILDFTKLLVFKIPNAPLNSQGISLAEELGYTKNTKLLVVNSDDTAAHPSFMEGVFETMDAGIVKSTSVIVHNHNEVALKRIATLSKKKPEWGIGVHLMLTNEYQNRYPWKPVLPKEIVPSLYNSMGLAWATIEEVELYANPKEVYLEFEAQIQKAITLGISISHLDSHMGTMYRNSYYPGANIDDLRMAAVKVAMKYNLPMTVNTFDKNAVKSIQFMDDNQMIRPDTFFGFYELEEMNSHMSYKGSSLKKWMTALIVNFVFNFKIPYTNKSSVEDDIPVRMDIIKTAVAKIVKPGLNHFYMHAAHAVSKNGQELPSGLNHAVGLDKIVRLSDAHVWSSKEMKAFLKKENIVLINYTRLQFLMEKRAKKNSGNLVDF